jgi:glycosyltransferase involved in cell wall biosynthesis
MHRAGLADRVLARHFRLEHTVATLADHLTFAHPAIAQSFRRRHNLPASKVSCITNGFDPDDFRGWQHATSERERVSVVHLGTFYGAYNPSPLKRALLLAQERCPRLIEQLKLVFVGGTPVRFDDIPGLAVEVTERVSHQEALRRLRDADVTLNVYERLVGEHNISGKLFEYLAAGRPILAIVPEDGATAEIVAACNAGFVADPDKPEEVLVAIQRCIDAARGRAPFCPDRAEIEKFSRYRLAGQLAATFARVETARAGE